MIYTYPLSFVLLYICGTHAWIFLLRSFSNKIIPLTQSLKVTIVPSAYEKHIYSTPLLKSNNIMSCVM